MENNKINEIGKKLDVKPSEIEKEQKNRPLRKSFWVLNALNLILSSTFGLIFGLFEHQYHSSYPFFFSKYGSFGFLGVIPVNITNGILTIPQRPYSILRKRQRIGIFSLNLILSIIGYGFLYSLFASSDQLTYAILYNVYDSSKKKQ